MYYTKKENTYTQNNNNNSKNQTVAFRRGTPTNTNINNTHSLSSNALVTMAMEDGASKRNHELGGVTMNSANQNLMTNAALEDEIIQMEPLLHYKSASSPSSSQPQQQPYTSSALMIDSGDSENRPPAIHSEFVSQAMKFTLCFAGLQISYLTWGYMQELIMTTKFNPTPSSPDGRFPSAAFCVFSNRFLAILVAMVAVRVKHGAIWSKNVAPLLAYTPCALSNTISSWSQYASLRYVSFPVQTVFKSSKIIPVMIMGKILKGTKYPYSDYLEAIFITIGVAIFSLASKESDSTTTTQAIGLLFMILYITADCFTSQWQDKVYITYGKNNVDPYQMMLGVNTSAIIITTTGLLVTGDFSKVYEFFQANPNVLQYNIITAITSASGQLCIYYTIKEFGPIVFTIIMTVRQMISICISAIIFGHTMSVVAILGAVIVFSILFYQIWSKYHKKKVKVSSNTNNTATNQFKG